MPRMFTDILGEIAGGRLVDSLSERLQEVVAAVGETRKVGKVTVELTVRPNGDHAVVITDKVSVKVPEAPHGDSVFFVVGSGDLTRKDPRQADLPLRRVGEPDRVAAHG
jgi:hypothetical protein